MLWPLGSPFSLQGPHHLPLFVGRRAMAPRGAWAQAPPVPSHPFLSARLGATEVSPGVSTGRGDSACGHQGRLHFPGWATQPSLPLFLQLFHFQKFIQRDLSERQKREGERFSCNVLITV